MCQNGCFGGVFLVCQVMLTIVLKGALSEMGSAHKACGFVVTLAVGPPLGGPHVGDCEGMGPGTLSAFRVFRGEGRHQSLKIEVRKRSFNGGSKKRCLAEH